MYNMLDKVGKRAYNVVRIKNQTRKENEMTPQERMIEYAKKNMMTDRLTPEQWCGQMATEGIVISRTPMSRTIAKATRKGSTIIVTETTMIENVDGSITETTVDALRIEL
jgi:hypothetical protein